MRTPRRERPFTGWLALQLAAWVHETDRPMRSDLERRGYTLDEVTLAMGIQLDDIRRGLGTALTLTHLHDALARRQTGSLQSTAMAERLYAAVGFRDLGPILEYGPSKRDAAHRESRRTAVAERWSRRPRSNKSQEPGG
jgi:hypothetical protein